MAQKRKRKRTADLPGTIYLNKNRYWWKVQLPGENKTKARPLKPVGARYATTDYAVAVECAKCLLQQQLFDSQAPLEGEVKIVPDLVLAYMSFAKSYYVDPEGNRTREPRDIKYAMQVLLDCFPSLPMDEFGPLRLKAVREAMIEKNWCRTLINQRIGMVRRMFKWAVSEQIVSPVILHGLQSVAGLKRGRTRAKEAKRILPVDERHVYAILAHTTPVVAAMIEMQLLTGMRPGELVAMRPAEAYCFSPAESEKQRLEKASRERKTPLSCGNRVGTNRKDDPKRTTGDKYDSVSYRKAVQYAITACNKPRQARGQGRGG